MTVSSTNTKVSFTGTSSNGTDGTSTFAYNFKVFANSEIKVIIRTTASGVETTKTLVTHYTVTGVGEDAGGNVVFTSGNNPLTTETIIIKRNNYQNNYQKNKQTKKIPKTKGVFPFDIR